MITTQLPARIDRAEARILAEEEFRQFGHQLVQGLRLNRQMDHEHWVDGLNDVQVRERAHLPTDELVAALGAVGPRAVAGRCGTPPPMRHLPLPFGPPIGWAPLTYLLDVGFTRDVWAHRIDIGTALGRNLSLTADHDGRLR
jgi:hypothetical protein